MKYTKVEMQISETAKVILKALLNPWEWKAILKIQVLWQPYSDR